MSFRLYDRLDELDLLELLKFLFNAVQVCDDIKHGFSYHKVSVFPIT